MRGAVRQAAPADGTCYEYDSPFASMMIRIAARRIFLLTALLVVALIVISAFLFFSASSPVSGTETWTKYPGNPVLGGPAIGTAFDVSVLKDDGMFKMYFSWRPKHSIGFTESNDGIHWSDPVVVLSPFSGASETEVNRLSVIKHDGMYQMWYTSQGAWGSRIRFASSQDGISWTPYPLPVLQPTLPWEKNNVMCPDVLWDASARLYRMWYSGGDGYEPNAIGYASSVDGIHWNKSENNPVFGPQSAGAWDGDRVSAPHVVPYRNGYAMFYIGFSDVNHAQIGIAWSADGVSGWKRYAHNPIVSPTKGAWDSDAVYKPYAMLVGDKWLLWYNGRSGGSEQIGLVEHQGADLGFR